MDNRDKFSLQNWSRTMAKFKNCLCIFDERISYVLCKNPKEFETNCNTKSEKYFRYINEIPTILFILIVIIAVLKQKFDKDALLI